MRDEISSGAVAFGLKLVAQGGGGAAAGLTTAAVATGDGAMNLAGSGLLVLAGMCGATGALYFRAHDKESAVRDTLITALFPFLLAVGLGPTIGAVFFLKSGLAGPHQTLLAEHIVGGLIVGLVATPIVRHIVANPVSDIIKALANKGSSK